VSENFLPVVGKALRIGTLVDSVDRRLLLLDQSRGHSFVREQHELLDELVGLVVFRFLNAIYCAFFGEVDFRLRKIELERAFRETLFSNELGEAICLMQHLFDPVAGPLLLDHLHRLFVRVATF